MSPEPAGAPTQAPGPRVRGPARPARPETGLSPASRLPAAADPDAVRPEGEENPPSPSGELRGAALARVLADSPALRARRLELLPLEGPSAPGTDPQGRQPSAPAELEELVSSIALVGLLQPILVEALPDGTHRVVAGERRLRAQRWGSVHLADNPHFRGALAVVCPGPLSKKDRRTWQLVENLARTPLASGVTSGIASDATFRLPEEMGSPKGFSSVRRIQGNPPYRCVLPF